MASVLLYGAFGVLEVPDTTIPDFEAAVSAARTSTKEYVTFGSRAYRIDAITMVEDVPVPSPETEE